ncbi:MAG: hypothetical protein KIT10_05420 [Flavobacteriales bacterium]|nr:hypothetical protein [Flavobacteriales bacterium]
MTKRILEFKLPPGRNERWLKLIWKGHVDLLDRCRLTPSLYQLAAWGWMQRHDPVHPMDPYKGYRPTCAGLEYLLFDENYHLILIKKQYVEAVEKRVMRSVEIEYEEAVADYFYRRSLEGERALPEYPMGLDEASWNEVRNRYVRKGYLCMKEFRASYGHSRDDLVVFGVLRYKDNEHAPVSIRIGEKAKHCLMYSRRWRTVFVRPGMLNNLVSLCHVQVVDLSDQNTELSVWSPESREYPSASH